jgi:thermopsin
VSFIKFVTSPIIFVLLIGSIFLEPTYNATGSRGGVSSAGLEQFISIPAGYFIPVEIDTFSNSSEIIYTVESNTSISTALMNSQQFTLFNNSESNAISNSLADHNGTSDMQNIRVPAGAYFIVFLDPSQFGTANVAFAFRVYPSTPFEEGPLLPPQPTGLASFGIYNESGNAIPYEIKTNSVIGVVNITSIQAHNSSAPSLNDTVSGATLQLNSMLVVNDNNSKYVYWCQDTPDFVSDASQVSFADNVWNNTDQSGYLSNQTITSTNGAVFPTNSNSSSRYYYGYQSSNFTYFEPLSLRVLMNERILPNTRVLLQMGIQVLRNGSLAALEPVKWFDYVTIHDPQAKSAYFYVSGNESTPIGTFYDAELVFGGEGNLEATHFNQMNSTLGLFYRNESSGQLSAFPSYYSFGGDTGEAAYNLHVTYSGDGIAQVTMGNPNYVYLEIARATTGSTTETLPQLSTTVTSVDVGSPSAIWNSDYLVVALIVVLVVLVGGFVQEWRKKVS